MAKKMPGRLVALSASAVATIYIAGLLSTQQAVESVAAASAAVAAPVVANPSLTDATADSANMPVVVGASGSVTTASSSTATPTAALSIATPVAASNLAATATASAATAGGTSTYANGTYAGTGTSRFGTVSVSVTTSGGKITNVQITRVTTSYPVSRIASLPAQVIQSQTATVNVVTGATYSSQAFKQAVQQALAQALAAKSQAAAG
jgi:uncharacterized protein with FMN-binding domain